VRAARAIVVDLLLAAAVLLAGIVQWATRNFADLGPALPPDELPAAPDALGLLLVVAAAVAVVPRRRAPLVALGLTSAASIAALALEYGVIVHLGPAVVLYEIARRPDRRAWWAGGALAGAALVAVAALEAASFAAAGDAIIDACLWAGAAGAGAWRRLADAQEDGRRRREQLEAAADERVRIARELHDTAGHAITNIAAHAGAARVLRSRDPERADAAIATLETLARQAMDEIDDIVSALRDGSEAQLQPQNGLAGIDELVERAGQAIEVERSGEPRPLPVTVEHAAYRIVQEGLTNAVRHGAGGTRLTVRYADRALGLELANRADRARADRRNGGRGLLGMRERATLLGGTLDAGERDGWFVLRATLPYER